MDFVAQVLDVNAGLQNLGYRPTRLVIDQGRWVQRWRGGVDKEHDTGRSLLILDLCNFYPLSMRTLAKWLGLEVQEMPLRKVPDDACQAVGESRVAVCLSALQVWLDFRVRQDLGYFAPTLASQAFNAYRHRFMTYPIYVHVHNDVYEIEREASFGGRNQIFFKGRAPSSEYIQGDVTSFYASVQYGQQFPVKQVGHSARVGLGKLAELLERYAIIARVEVNTEEPRFPKRTEQGTIYPVGHYDTTLTTPELKAALHGGNILRVREIVTYEQAPIFDDYIRFFWEIRQRAMRTDDAYIVELTKRFLNTLYGKFGQRIWLSRVVGHGIDAPDQIWQEYDWQDRRSYEYRIIAGRMEQQVRDVPGRDTLLAIPAHVTAYGRCKLWELMTLAGLENVMYVDNDSLIIRHAALRRFARLLRRDTLGGLRLCGTSPYLYIRAPKWYVFGDTTRRAGVKSGAHRLSWGLYEQEDDRSMRWALSHGNPHCAISEEVTITAPQREVEGRRQLGQRVPYPRLGDAPTRLRDGSLALPLPLELPRSMAHPHA